MKHGNMRRFLPLLAAVTLFVGLFAAGCTSANKEVVATCGGDPVLREEYSFLAGKLTDADLGEEEIREKIAEITEIVSSPMLDAELNDAVPTLNNADKLNAAAIAGMLENAVEVNALCAPEAKTYLCRIGGIAAAAVVFDGGENAAELNAGNLAKVREFTEFAACYRLPLVVFSDVAVIAPCTCTHNSRVL